MNERKTRPRWQRHTPNFVTAHSVVYEDNDYPFRYMFTSLNDGYVEVRNDEGVWWRVETFMRRRSERTHVDELFKRLRKDAAESLVNGFASIVRVCAIAATGGEAVLHFGGPERITLCGIQSGYSLGVQAYVNSTADLLGVTCGECRVKLINTVNAMPFLAGEHA